MKSCNYICRCIMYVCCAVVLSAASAAAYGASQPEKTSAVSLGAPMSFSSAAGERDAIFMLAAYAVVYKDWQSSVHGKYRGHNIGCILVDPEGNPVAWNRNCSGVMNDSTQHGEVRAMQDYIRTSGNKYLGGYTVYTTLEPCAMCSGMMCLTKVGRCVYGETDDNYPDGSAGYGRAMERLRLDSSSLHGGLHPYPRTPAASEPSDLDFRRILDSRFSGGSESNITLFLVSDSAKEIYRAASDCFYGFKVTYPENRKLYEKTVCFVDRSTK